MTREEAIKIIEFIDTRYMTLETAERNALKMAIKALKQEPSDDDYQTDMDEAWKQAKREPCDDVVSREAVINLIRGCNSALEEPRIFDCHNAGVKFEQYITELPSVRPQEPKTGHWSRKTKVDAYDIAGVKTWGIKCQCDRCDFTTIVVEDFGYYKYCPNCGARMVEPQESEDKK